MPPKVPLKVGKKVSKLIAINFFSLEGQTYRQEEENHDGRRSQ